MTDGRRIPLDFDTQWARAHGMDSESILPANQQINNFYHQSSVGLEPLLKVIWRTECFKYYFVIIDESHQQCKQ